jgi:spore maturation protein CgeB
MVIQDNSSVRSVLEVAACGTFQLNSISTNRNLDTDVFQSYNSQEELIEKFDFYWNRVDQRRLAASRAMAYVKYNHSYLQSSLQLLDRIYR